MKRNFMKKMAAGLLAFCTVIGAIGSELMMIGNAASDNGYESMENLEKDFSGYLYDDVTANIGAGAVLKGDVDVATLENAQRYASGGYTSLADYLYSFNNAGELVRDLDYSFNGNKKTGLLYYNKTLTDFELSFEYKHSQRSGVGWNGIYVGMGASEKGKVWANEKGNFAVFVQRNEHHAISGGTTTIPALETGKVNYSSVIEKYKSDKAAWYSFKFVVEGNQATWYIDGNEIASYTVDSYAGGYIYFGTMSGDTAFKDIAVLDKSEPYTSMAGIEKDFKAAFQDQATGLSASSKIVTDENIETLDNYKTKYVPGKFTSLADYLFSVDANGVLVRDNDVGTSGNRKNGFLYYNTKMKDFTLEMEYKHSIAGAGGWKSIYVGVGAQEVGNNHFTDKQATSIRLQPKEMYFENQAGTTNFANNADYKNYIAAQYNADEKSGEASWYTFKLTVKNGVATWEINGKTFTGELKNYIGGYLYIGGMTLNTAFRNIKITSGDVVDYSAYDVYYPVNYSQNVTNLTAIQKTDFENCWSLEEGTFTRIGSGNFAGGSSNSYGASMLYFKQQKYEAFEMEFDYSFGSASTGWKWAAIGFGADEPGRSYIDGDGYLAFIEQEGYISYIHPDSNNGKLYKNDRITTKEVPEYRDTVKGVKNEKWHHAKLKAASGYLTISYDGGEEVTVPIKDYSGYIYLCSFTPTMQFKNISITEVKDVPSEFESQFTAYYLPNGTLANKDFVPLTAADVSDLWVETVDTLTRSGSGKFAAGPKGARGASMLYFKDTYTNFSLSYDFTLAGDKNTWKWVGAGFGASEQGKYYGDGDGFMAYIEQEGYRSLYTGKTSSRIEGLLESYQELLANGDDTWHKFNLVVKGDTVEIFLDNYTVARTTIKEYRGGYVYLFGATPGMKMKNIAIEEIAYIASAENIPSITVKSGTPVSALNLPTSINVTLNDGTFRTLPLTWDSSNYNANTAGKYVLTGTIDITGTNVYKNDSGRTVKLVVTVADFDMSQVKSYDFVSDSQINDTFISYYVGESEKVSATSVLKGAAASLTWAPTENGGLKRTGTGEYRPSTKQNLAGSLLYFKDRYTEFELEFDYTFNGTTKGWRWVSVGVGAEQYGMTGYHANGGTLAVVEMEGQIRTFTNNKPTLITDKEAFKGYKETLSDSALNLSTVHHLRVSVKNSRMYVYVDNYPAADTPLTNYNGGYIYLYGFTENLELSNVRLSSIVTAEIAQEVPYKSVQKGTSISGVSLPSTLKVKVNGQIIDCPVKWSSPDYNGNVEGTYNFFATPTGAYSHLWLSNDTKRLQVGVTVGNTDEDVVQKFALRSTEELEAYFENYYCPSQYQLFEKDHWKPTYAGNTWKVDSQGILKRTGRSQGGFGGGAKGTYGVSSLYYKDKLENFEIEFDYRHGTAGWRWVAVAFGAKNIGDTYYDNGYQAWVEREGKVRIQGSTNGQSKNFTDPFSASRVIDGYADKVAAIRNGESDEWFHYRLVVTNKVARVYINDTLWSCSLADDYRGGYVSLSLNASNTTIKNLSITNYDAKEVIIAAIQSTKSIGYDYIEIDKTKGDTLSLPDEMVVTDTNGYTYRVQMDWVNNNYRSGKLGTYQFVGVPVMPSKMFKNPKNVTAASTVKVVKVDYNPARTVKYYFDNDNDLLDFTDYYSENTAEKDLAVSNWEKHWTLQDGQLQRINDDFRNPSGDKFGTYRKVSRLTYNKKLTGNYQIDVDYKQDSGTYMWAMICFATSDRTQFVVEYDEKEGKFKQNTQGGTAVYLEKEGTVNYWGNMTEANLDDTRLRLLQTADKFEGYDSKQMHHMTVTVIDGVARVFIDKYDTSVAIRVPEEALGGYVSLMSNSNAVTFDNLAITTLGDNAKDGNIVKAGDTSGIAINYKNMENAQKSLMDSVRDVLGIVIPVAAISIAIGSLIVLLTVQRKKAEKIKEES